ncbi:YopX family protein [Clostridium sporogenes]|uniref:YopX family protein n=1 Tax=Clostridium sporogenes TaxID=1509 RepID=UPI002237C440|nr:YopX family protein [Clostridium sporogenes]MCW6059763.1 YopX family protein [Clostridium sporogenes]MCW6067284.1 YopX family protein [Clostridium sporogenes]
MNRDIKFNVYDKTTNTYYSNKDYDINIYLGRRMLDITEKNKNIDLIVLDYENEIECVLLEYTGLKDKNGKEIYEGDIVSIEIKDKTIKNKIIASSNEVVEYKDCKFGVVWGWHRDFIGLDGFYNTTFEVIGNVYEDPKLLQEDKHEKK